MGPTPDPSRPALWLADPERSVGFTGIARVAEQAGFPIGGFLDVDGGGGDPAPDDVVVSDPTRTPLSIARDLDQCRHLALTHRRDEPFVLRTLRAGFEGFLLYSTPTAEVVDALEQLSRGDVVMTCALAAKVAACGARLADADFWPGMTRGLTRRESEVLEGASHGESTREIAERLVVGEETVRSHLKSLYQKLGVSDRSAAVAHAFRDGILSPDAG